MRNDNTLRIEDAHNNHVSRVRILTSAGIEPPAEWTALKDRYGKFLALDNPCTELLAQAVVSGDTTADVPALRALAFAERSTLNSPDRGTVRDIVKGAVTKQLKAIYAPHAVDNYRKITVKYAKLGAEFAAATAIVDPEIPAEQIVDATANTRKAWSDAPSLAAQLTKHLPVLQAAAELAGIQVRDPNLAPRSPRVLDALLPLAIDTRGLHRRRVWDAWETDTGRTGRWGELSKLGATIHACPLDEYQPYRRPKQLLERWVVQNDRRVRIIVDPEDDELATAAR